MVVEVKEKKSEHTQNLLQWRCRVRGLNRRACLFSELVTGVTVAMVAQRYASGTRKRKVRRSIVLKLLQDSGQKQRVAIRKISIEGDPDIF